ncbi:hypothetical protein BS78_01G168800 [Paspalum vaginatum]|nr:hypothetical protein BS78_01G168800 [Paspalum vaginatum]
MDEWVGKRSVPYGCSVSEDQIVAYVRKFRKHKEHARALELMEWMEACGAKLRRGHHALHLGLVSKVHGIQAAEEYFWNLPDIFKSIETYSCLLNCYGDHKMADKGLELYEKMKAMNIVPNTLVYNNLMSLYRKVEQPEKIPATFKEMQGSSVSGNDFTYFTLIESYLAMNDLDAAEKVLEDLQKVAPVHWSLYTLMAVWQGRSDPKESRGSYGQG